VFTKQVLTFKITLKKKIQGRVATHPYQKNIIFLKTKKNKHNCYHKKKAKHTIYFSQKKAKT
jgi:hypothetical protein